MLHGNYLCLEEFNKKQIEEVRSKIRAEKSETRATPKQGMLRNGMEWKMVWNGRRIWVCNMEDAQNEMEWKV